MGTGIVWEKDITSRLYRGDLNVPESMLVVLTHLGVACRQGFLKVHFVFFATCAASQ